ncbi:hypothetical protein [Paenibacillus sp. HB172176]|uniref:hypothetical protein n=1 Tax=Paenibacillus sp. HB172176 TaxID=2493690 RepID=UPI0014390C8C|nr:hypothetical protein [Paenibacillus sp. HB172176]
MKQYISHRHLRLVGKGWELRHQLRKLASSAEGASLLAHLTNCRSSIRTQSGSSIAIDRKNRAWRKLKLAKKRLVE